MKELIEKLKKYNAWRRGDETVPQPHPQEVGEMIDRAIEALEGVGDAEPVKKCGEGHKPDKKGSKGCGAYIMASAMICQFCGYTYPTEKERIKAEFEEWEKYKESEK